MSRAGVPPTTGGSNQAQAIQRIKGGQSKVKEKMEIFKEKVANPPSMKGTNAVYQFVLEGENGGDYYITFTDGAGELNEGLAEKSDITLIAKVKDFVALTEGKLSPMMAFMSGKLKIKGDMSLAMKLQGLLG